MKELSVNMPLICKYTRDWIISGTMEVVSSVLMEGTPGMVNSQTEQPVDNDPVTMDTIHKDSKEAAGSSAQSNNDHDDLAQQTRHIVNVMSNLHVLQKEGKFCDVCFFCSDGYVEGNLGHAFLIRWSVFLLIPGKG